MRIVVFDAAPTGLGAALAAHLNVVHIRDVGDIAADGFVLEGAPRDVTAAHDLDMLLRRRAADITAVLWVRGGPLSPQKEAVLDYFRGRVVELDPAEDPFESALSGLREALLTR